MVFLSRPKKKESTQNFKNEMLQLKKELKQLIKVTKEKNKKNSEKIYVEPIGISNIRIEKLENELRELKEKYILMLETMVEKNSEGKEKINLEISDRLTIPQGELNLGVIQILSLLKESRATTIDFAVTAAQLKEAFGFDKSKKTIKNRLNYLARHKLVTVIGKRPKAYFITPTGLRYLYKQERGVLKIDHEII